MRPVIASSESIAPSRPVMIQMPDPETDEREDRNDRERGPGPAARRARGGASATGVVGAAMVPVTRQPPWTIAAED